MAVKITAYQTLSNSADCHALSIRNNLLAKLGYKSAVGIPFIFPRPAQAQLTSLLAELTDVDVFDTIKVRVEIEAEGRLDLPFVTRDEFKAFEMVKFDGIAHEFRTELIGRMEAAGNKAPTIKSGTDIFLSPQAIDWLVSSQPEFRHIKAVAFPSPIPKKKGAFLNLLLVYDLSIIKSVVNTSDPQQDIVIY